jgi:hypothetical protein
LLEADSCLKAAARLQFQESKQFFFEKKNQKTFASKALVLPQRARQMGRSFCFFFQKEGLPCLSKGQRQGLPV